MDKLYDLHTGNRSEQKRKLCIHDNALRHMKIFNVVLISTFLAHFACPYDGRST